MKIPEGWRKLRPGTKVRHGDKFWGVDEWIKISAYEGMNPPKVEDGETVIRKKGKKQ